MALIWAEGFNDEKALAPSWRHFALALARSKDQSLTDAERFAAMVQAEKAKTAYDHLVSEAETELAQGSGAGKSRTHVLVVGVGRYDSPGIPALTTSIYGAWAFADWMLATFRHDDRPLGSVELLLSPSESPGHWQPSLQVAKKLGLTDGTSTETLPVEAATFSNIKNAFDRWLNRAGAGADNAAFLYFSGHGLWKAVPLLLPEDARIGTTTHTFENLIDIKLTEQNMLNVPPSIQCFFIDACQEINSALIQNLDKSPGEPLRRAVNARAIPNRDAWLYIGSYIGRNAYGPDDRAPFFTQELIACLERRGADGTMLSPNTWVVTTDSLRKALEAASRWRREIETEAKNIQFSVSPGSSNFTAELCQFEGNPEAFVRVWCLPRDRMLQARLFVESGGTRQPRPVPLYDEWYIPVAHGDCLAGVEFDPSAFLQSASESFVALPPVRPVRLRVQPGTGESSGRNR